MREKTNLSDSFVTNRSNLIKTLIQTSADDLRIVVNGASGWFGKNMSESLFDFFGVEFESCVLLLGSRDQLVELQNGRKLRVNRWSRELITEFSPTHVIQLAFKTRDYVGEMSIDDYLEINQEIIDNALWMISLPSLRGFLHTSSGAALGLNVNDKYLDPYGYLKKFEEEVYPEACAKNDKDYLGLRVWSTTGRYIKTGGVFAIESLISQALSNNSIRIESPSDVIRSYADANEILMAGMLGLFAKKQGIFNSGGTEIEIGELAALIAELSPGKGVEVVRSPTTTEKPSVYRSMGPSIEQILIDHGLSYSCMQEQVMNTMRYLIWKKHTLSERPNFED